MHDPSAPPTVVFVCAHGAVKSVVAAAYLQRLAEQRGLSLRATAAGLEPDPEVPAAVAEHLLADGIDVRGYRPRGVTRGELSTAWRIVTFGCDLGGLASPGRPVLRWDDVPSLSEDFAAGRAAITAHLDTAFLDWRLP